MTAHASLRRDLEVHQDELAAQNEQLRTANAELMTAKERYALLYDVAPTGYLTLDAAGRVVEANVASSNLLGVERNTLFGRSFDDLVAPAERESFRKFRRRLLDGDGKQDSHETVLTTSSSELLFVWIDGARLVRESGDGKHNECILCLRDQTVLKEAERNRRDVDAGAAEAQRLESLGLLAGGIAHEFNNLFAVVLASTELSLQSEPPAPHRDSLRDIRGATERAAVLAKQMLAYSGRGYRRHETLDLAQLVSGMEPLLRVSVPKNIELVLQLDDDVGEVRGDPVQIQQVVLNLIVNAAEAIGGRDGRIVLTTRAGESHAEIEVLDDGPGMDATTRRKAFDPFFSTKFTGRGLGLAVAYGNVRGHGGTISIASRPRRGTAFVVSLPFDPDGVDATHTSHGGTARREPGLVLVVDDETAFRNIVARALSQLGFTVRVAIDGVDALEQVREEPSRFDCVLLDLTMPRMDGAKALHALKGLRPSLPVVLMSGYAAGTIDSALLHRADDFLTKPFTLARLATIMKRLVGSASIALSPQS